MATDIHAQVRHRNEQKPQKLALMQDAVHCAKKSRLTRQKRNCGGIPCGTGQDRANVAGMDANHAYRDAHERAARHLRRIEALLAQHAQRQAATPENWAHVGQMKLIEGELAELVDLLDRPTTKETRP